MEEVSEMGTTPADRKYIEIMNKPMFQVTDFELAWIKGYKGEEISPEETAKYGEWQPASKRFRKTHGLVTYEEGASDPTWQD